jgi:hypothetical protein
MAIATRKDIQSVFPDLVDRALVEILDMQATVDDLEAALAMLASEDKELIEIRRREGDRINKLLSVLAQAGIEAPPNRER